MEGVNRNRLRWGAIAWLLTLQFFVVEAIAASRFDENYSRADDVISDLGTAESAARMLMNASFVVQGLLIAAGALLLGPGLSGTGGRVARVLLVAAGIGVLLVGVFPSDGNATAHLVGATVHLLDENDKPVTYQIVGQTEADAKVGRISYSSPLGRALIGRSVGDEVEVSTPSGDRYYSIEKVEFI